MARGWPGRSVRPSAVLHPLPRAVAEMLAGDRDRSHAALASLVQTSATTTRIWCRGQRPSGTGAVVEQLMHFSVVQGPAQSAFVHRIKKKIYFLFFLPPFEGKDEDSRVLHFYLDRIKSVFVFPFSNLDMSMILICCFKKAGLFIYFFPHLLSQFIKIEMFILHWGIARFDFVSSHLSSGNGCTGMVVLT